MLVRLIHAIRRQADAPTAPVLNRAARRNAKHAGSTPFTCKHPECIQIRAVSHRPRDR